MQNLAEDDEFEEFKQEDWQPTGKQLQQAALWDNAWDDDDLSDPISQQLRANLQHAAPAPPPAK